MAESEQPSAPASPARPTSGGLVASGVLLAALALFAFIGIRRALSISLPADWACAAAAVLLFAWVALDLRRRLTGRARPPAGRIGRWFALRPGVAAWTLLLPIAAWFALRVPGGMGSGPVDVPFDRAPFSKGPWHEGPVLVVTVGDSIGTGYGVAPGRGYFDLLVRNDLARHPEIGDADLSHVLPRLASRKLASLSTNSIDHEQSLAFLAPQPSDTFGLVFVTTGGIDLIHPYGHGEPREGAMYGATLTEAQPWIERFEARVDRMLETIERRFPGGSETFVATIYDPTDGVGDIEHASVVGWLPAWPDALEIHGRFNRAIRAACARHGSAHVLDVHRVMLGHGIHCRDASNPHYDRADPTYWYWWNLEDPNERGYDAIRRLCLAEVGAVLPARLELRRAATSSPASPSSPR